MKTLVTGASGFIGSAVVRGLLARGREVRALVAPGAHTRNLDDLDVEIVEGDIRERDAVWSAVEGTSSVFHLAAIYKLWLPRTRLMYEVNVEGTRNVLFAALRAEVAKVVHTSSIAAIGLPEPGELADETTEFESWDESSDYIRSKWLSEREALDFAAYGLPVVVVNPAFPFGERDTAPTPTGRFIVEALAGRIPGYAEGGFNVVDVDDVAEGHLLAEQRGRVGERYILGNHNLTYEEFFHVVTEIAGLPPIKRQLPRRMVQGVAWLMERYASYTHKEPYITPEAADYASHRVWLDTSKARDELQMPQTSLPQTIEKAIRWFRDNGYA